MRFTRAMNISFPSGTTVINSFQDSLASYGEYLNYHNVYDSYKIIKQYIHLQPKNVNASAQRAPKAFVHDYNDSDVTGQNYLSLLNYSGAKTGTFPAGLRMKITPPHACTPRFSGRIFTKICLDPH